MPNDKLSLSADKYPYHCTACGKGYTRQKDNFNVSPSPYFAANNGYLPICKRCLEKSYSYYRDQVFDGDQDKAMELLCATVLSKELIQESISHIYVPEHNHLIYELTDGAEIDIFTFWVE